MPKRANELKAYQLRRINRPGMHAAGGVAGLYFLVGETAGARSWILRAKLAGKRPDIGLGSFPEISLEVARARATAARDLIRQGVDPRESKRTELRQAVAAAVKRKTFEQAARACHLQKSKGFRNAKHSAQWINTLVTYAFPTIGDLWVEDIQTEHIRALLEPIWFTKTETADRVRGRIENVMAYAKASKLYAHENPATWECLEPLLAKPGKLKKKKHHPAWPWARMGEFWPLLRAEPGMNARCLEFSALTACRSIESRAAKWDEIDKVAKVWKVPGERMKGGLPHRVPLSDAALMLLALLPRMKDCPYIFCERRNKKSGEWQLLSENAMAFPIAEVRQKLCAKLGADQPEATPHGFRSSFKDWARSQPAHEDEVTELSLAHVNSDETRAAYARDELLPKRAVLMAQWATYVETRPRPTNVVSIRAGS